MRRGTPTRKFPDELWSSADGLMQVLDPSCREEQQLQLAEVVDSGPTPPLKHPGVCQRQTSASCLPPSFPSSTQQTADTSAATAIVTAVYCCCAALNTFVLPECFIYEAVSARFVWLRRRAPTYLFPRMTTRRFLSGVLLFPPRAFARSIQIC